MARRVGSALRESIRLNQYRRQKDSSVSGRRTHSKGPRCDRGNRVWCAFSEQKRRPCRLSDVQSADRPANPRSTLPGRTGRLAGTSRFPNRDRITGQCPRENQAVGIGSRVRGKAARTRLKLVPWSAASLARPKGSPLIDRFARLRFCVLEAKTPDMERCQKWECNTASLAHHRPRQRGSAPRERASGEFPPYFSISLKSLK